MFLFQKARSTLSLENYFAILYNNVPSLRITIFCRAELGIHYCAKTNRSDSARNENSTKDFLIWMRKYVRTTSAVGISTFNAVQLFFSNYACKLVGKPKRC